MIIGRVTLLDIILWEELSSFPLSSSSVSLLLRGGGIKIQHRELKTGKHNLRLHVKCQLKVIMIHPDMSLFANNILALFQQKSKYFYCYWIAFGYILYFYVLCFGIVIKQNRPWSLILSQQQKQNHFKSCDKQQFLQDFLLQGQAQLDQRVVFPFSTLRLR